MQTYEEIYGELPANASYGMAVRYGKRKRAWQEQESENQRVAAAYDAQAKLPSQPMAAWEREYHAQNEQRRQAKTAEAVAANNRQQEADALAVSERLSARAFISYWQAFPKDAHRLAREYAVTRGFVKVPEYHSVGDDETNRTNAELNSPALHNLFDPTGGTLTKMASVVAAAQSKL